MILLLDSSDPFCKLTLIEDDRVHEKTWEAHRELAHGLLDFIRSELELQGASWEQLTGIGVYQGPGSFTGLRIGMTVLNTLADTLNIPIVGSTEDNWQDEVLMRLRNNENDSLVLPYYGGDANITKPRK